VVGTAAAKVVLTEMASKAIDGVTPVQSAALAVDQLYRSALDNLSPPVVKVTLVVTLTVMEGGENDVIRSVLESVHNFSNLH